MSRRCCTSGETFADLLQELKNSKKSGALYVSIAEKSEDMARVYFRNGDLHHVRYGTAIGNDCLDILEFYTMNSASFYDGIDAPICRPRTCRRRQI